jgi:shikimate kinase
MIFLIGYMGSGKTSKGKNLARALQVPFIDLDSKIEEKTGQSIPEIFEKEGEQSFRETEASVLRNLKSDSLIVISTGGGTPCFFDNMQWMNENGLTIYFEMPAAALYSRLKNAKKKRPLLMQQQDPEAFISKHLKERDIYYRQAKHIINGLSIETRTLANEIRDMLS